MKCQIHDTSFSELAKQNRKNNQKRLCNKSIKLLVVLFISIISIKTNAQVGISTTAPMGALDITSINNGVLIPRVTLTAKNVALPVVNPQGGTLENSTLVYNTASSGVAPNNVIPAFYYWETVTSSWKLIATETTSNPNTWNTLGNSGTSASTNFLGTTDNTDLVFKRNNIRSGLLNDSNFNTAFGVSALNALTSGFINSAFGKNALADNTSGAFNVALGAIALKTNVSGNNNVAIGYQSNSISTTGFNNVSVGNRSLVGLTSGNNNTVIGNNSGSTLTTGNFNIAIGSTTSFPNNSASNQLNIGNWIYGNNGAISIGNTIPNASAILELNSTTKGILLPRMTKTQRDAIIAPVAGLMIFQIDNIEGLRVFNGFIWVRYSEIAD